LAYSKLTSTFLLTSFIATLLSAHIDNEKTHALKNNGLLIYNKQNSVDSFHNMFTQGDFYGRLRSNNFYFMYDKPDSSHYTQTVGSVGGSFVFKSAHFKGFDTTLGIYASQAFFNDKNDPAAYLKASKDTFSRYNYVNTGSKSMGVLGQ